MEDFTGYGLARGDIVVYAVQDKYARSEGGSSTRMRLGRVIKETPKGLISVQRIGPESLPSWKRIVTTVHPSVVYRHDGEIPEGWY